jgi:tetratricopeptide (TPR) repeat protein
MRTLIFLVGALWAMSSIPANAEVAAADSVRKYKFLAKTSRQKKEYTEAIKYYGKLMIYSPKNIQANFFLGDMHYRTRDFDGARVALKKALSLDSLHVNSNLRLYSIYITAGIADSAAQCLERILVSKPAAADHRRKLADLYRRDGNNERAVFHYNYLASAGLEDEELYEMLALLYQDLGQMNKALEWRRKLLGGGESGPSVEQLESVVALQLETGDVAGGYKSLLKLALVDSANAYSYYSRLSTLAGEKNDEPMLLNAREGMVRANPKDLETVAQLVQWNLNEDRLKAARGWLERGLSSGEDAAHLLVLKGDLLLRQGAEDEALAAYEKAKADPAWKRVAQQRIWKINPPETEEEKLKREFFGGKDG